MAFPTPGVPVPGVGRVCVGVMVLALLLVLGGCSAGPGAEPTIRAVAIDGGTEVLLAVRGVNVQARPGDTIAITNANQGMEGRAAAEASTEGTVTHALVVAGTNGPPPVFVTGAGGAIPNPPVWGSCRGGDPDGAVGECPILPIDGPSAWDGTGYWSTGAMLPGETREVPLSDDITTGTHRLVCALHPELTVDVVVTDDPTEDPAAGEAPLPDAPDSIVPDEPTPGEVLVAPGSDTTRLNAFWPATVTVAAGEAVTWTSTARAPHDVVLGFDEPPELVHSTPVDALPDAPDGPWDGTTQIRSGYLQATDDGPAGATFSVTFADPGTYEYVCRFHPSMRGTVVVS